VTGEKGRPLAQPVRWLNRSGVRMTASGKGPAAEAKAAPKLRWAPLAARRTLSSPMRRLVARKSAINHATGLPKRAGQPPDC